MTTEGDSSCHIMLCGVPNFLRWWSLTLVAAAFAFFTGWVVGRPGGL